MQDSCNCLRISEIELRTCKGQAFNSRRRARNELSSQLTAGPQDDDFVSRLCHNNITPATSIGYMKLAE